MNRDEAILKAIKNGETFWAHKMLLIRDAGKTAKTAGSAAWFEGEERGAKRIADFVEAVEAEAAWVVKNEVFG